MIAFQLICGFIGSIIVLNALFDAMVKRRKSFVFKSYSLKKSPVRFVSLILMDIIIGGIICYRSYIGTFAIGTTIALIIAYNFFSLAFINGVNKIIDEEEDDDEERGTGFAFLFFGVIIGSLIIYYSVTTGISISDIGDFIVDFLDA